MKTLWRQVKGMIRDIEQDDGVLIFDPYDPGKALYR